MAKDLEENDDLTQLLTTISNNCKTAEAKLKKAKEYVEKAQCTQISKDRLSDQIKNLEKTI